MKKLFLVTTAIEKTWPQNKPILFLGEWCKDFLQRERWEKIDAKVLPYHWDNRAKLYSDNLYLQDFYEILLHELAQKLNQIHGTEHGIRYWRILIGPWLGYFIPMLFDRWTSIHDAINNYELSGTIVQVFQEGSLVPNDMTDFMKLLNRADWNHHIYANILMQCTRVHCIRQNVQQIKKHSHVVSDVSWSQKIRQSLFVFYDKIASLLCQDKDAFFITTYLSYVNEIKLCLRMTQVPRYLSNIPSIEMDVNSSKRKWRLLGENRSEFEAYARVLIPQQIPTLYLEGFAKLTEQVTTLSWPSNPKVIFTSSSWSTNDVFKAYAADKTEQGTPLVIGQHGGGIGTHLWDFNEGHTLDICDYYFSWGWTEISKPKVKAVGQLKAQSPLGIQHSKQNGIMLVTVKFPIQSYHMFSAPVASQWLDYFNDQCVFVETLITPIRDVLTVRLKSDDYGWQPIARWRDRYPDIVLDEGHSDINSLIKKSRIYVSTYNATTFLQSFTMNVPTVMYWNPNHWELRDSAIPFFDRLKDVGILHDTPESAAEHVNAIWEDVNFWWEGDIVQEALKSFIKRYSHIPKDGIVSQVSYALKEATLISENLKKC